METELEDELGDILQKARDGKAWSQNDLARATGISLAEIARIENYQFTPPDAAIQKLADALDLHGPSLVAIAKGDWIPAQKTCTDPDFELICLRVLMGLYPVKCYLLICKKTRETAVIDTGANPEAIIKKAGELGVQPTKILLTHAHPDHAGGLKHLDRQFNCPTWICPNEPRPSGSRDFRLVKDEDRIELGKIRIRAISTPGHTSGGVSYHINKAVVSGDAIFAGSMGRANSSWSDLYHSITNKLLTLPDDTTLYPGHGPSTTVGEERSHNPFFCGKV